MPGRLLDRRPVPARLDPRHDPGGPERRDLVHLGAREHPGRLVRARFEQEPAKKKAKKVRAAKGRAPAVSAAGGGAEDDLFERLRALRLELARAAGVPPYVVFHDSTLREMALLKPTTLAHLAQLPGIGEKKLERYGERFLALLRDAEGSD